MKTTLIIYFLFFGIIGYSQIATKIIEIDVSKPHKKSVTIYKDSLSKDLDSSKWLSVKSRELVSIKLINGNPLRNTFKIDTKEISFHNDEGKKPDNTLEKIQQEAANWNDFKGLLPKKNRSIETILDKNKNLTQSIDSLNFEIENFYEILKQKSKLSENDYSSKRQEFLDIAKGRLKNSYGLLYSLKNFENEADYSGAQKSLTETKDKVEKSIKTIIQQFYTIDLNVYTPPIDIQGKNIDVIEFKLRRFNKETKSEDKDFAVTPYNIWIKGGLKIDVSAGLFFTSLYDSEFSTKDDPAIAGNKIITFKNGGDYDLAFGSTINTYVRMNSWVVPTLNFGAVITQNQKLQILLGGGIILGKQERIIFSGGLTMGKVSRIEDSYSVGGSYNLGNSGDVPTQNQFKFGHFFGITYNLTKVKKISLDKGIEQN